MVNLLKRTVTLSLSLVLGIASLQADVVPQTTDPTNSDTFKGWVDNTDYRLSDLTISGETYSGPGSKLPYGEFVYVNEVNFPDPKFRQCIKEVLANLDHWNPSDAWIPKNCEFRVVRLNYPVGITSVEGIEYLTDLAVLDITNNPIQQLDLSKNKKLHTLTLKSLQLQSIDFSSNPDLDHVAIENCSFNEVDFSQNPELSNLTIRETNITSLNLENNPDIWKLILADIPLTTLDVSNLSKLGLLYITGTQIETLDLSQNKALYDQTNLSRNRLSSVVFNNSADVWKIDLSNNQLTELPALPSRVSNLNISNNQITELPELPPVLKYLYANNNQIEELPQLPSTICEIDITNNKVSSLTNLPVSLKKVWASNNLLTEVDLQGCKIDSMDLTNNRLTSIDLSNCGELKVIYLSSNPLTDLTVGAAIKVLEVDSIPLTTLDLSMATNLYHLSANNCNLQHLDLSNAIKINDLYVNNNRIESLDASPLYNLYVLEADNNNLSLLKINPSITPYRISVANNNLDTLELDPAKLKWLNYLDVSNNQLDGELDLSKAKYLRKLNCSDNKLKSLILPNKCSTIENSGQTLYCLSATTIYPQGWQWGALLYDLHSVLRFGIYEGNYLDCLHNQEGVYELKFANNQLTSLKLHGERRIGVDYSESIYHGVGTDHYTAFETSPARCAYDPSMFNPVNNGRHLNKIEKAYVGMDKNGKEKYIYYLRLDEPTKAEQHINDRIGYDFDLNKVVNWKSGAVIIDGKRNKLAPALAKRGVSQADIDEAHVEGKILLLDEDNPRITYDYNTEGKHPGAYSFVMDEYSDEYNEWREFIQQIPEDFTNMENPVYVTPLDNLDFNNDPTSTVEFYLTWDPEADHVITGVAKIDGKQLTVENVRYVNTMGMVSDEPFEGVNIVVTKYTDGSTTTVKQVR